MILTLIISSEAASPELQLAQATRGALTGPLADDVLQDVLQRRGVPHGSFQESAALIQTPKW